MSISVSTAIKALVEPHTFQLDDGTDNSRHMPVYAVGGDSVSNRVPELRDRKYPYVTVMEWVSSRLDVSDNQYAYDSKMRAAQEIQVDLFQVYLDPVTQARVESKTLPLQLLAFLAGNEDIDTRTNPLPTRAYGIGFVGMHSPPDPDLNLIHHVLMFDIHRNMRP